MCIDPSWEIPRITYLCKCPSDIYQAYKQQQPFQADGKQKHIIICRPTPSYQTTAIDYFLLSPQEQHAHNMPFPKFAAQFYSIKPSNVLRTFLFEIYLLNKYFKCVCSLFRQFVSSLCAPLTRFPQNKYYPD